MTEFRLFRPLSLSRKQQQNSIIAKLKESKEKDTIQSSESQQFSFKLNLDLLREDKNSNITERKKLPRLSIQYQALSQQKRASPDLLLHKMDNQQGYYPTPSPLPIQQRMKSLYIEELPEQRLKTIQRKSISPYKINLSHRRVNTDMSELNQSEIKNQQLDNKKLDEIMSNRRIKVEKCQIFFPNVEPIEQMDKGLRKIYKRNQLNVSKIDSIVNRVRCRAELNDIIFSLRQQCLQNKK